MDHAGVVVHESIEVVDHDLVEIRRRVTATIGRDPAYRHGPGDATTLCFVRSYRPSWSVVLAWITAVPLLGGGLLFLLVRRSETCSVMVSPGPRGGVVTISGRLRTGLLEDLRTAVQRPVRQSTYPEVEGVPTTPRGRRLQTSTEALSEAEVTAHGHIGSPQERPAGSRVVLVFDSGLEFPLATAVLVGRDPAPMCPADAGAQLVGLDDPGRSISKTHFAAGPDRGGVWIEDRHSTNGTTVVDGAGHPVKLTPGQRTLLPIGAVVLFGDRQVGVRSL